MASLRLCLLLLTTASALSCALGAEFVATATYYRSIHHGACGYGNLVHSLDRSMIAAVSDGLYDNGSACGKCFALTCADRVCPTVVVRVTDWCPPKGNMQWCYPSSRHFDLSIPVFEKLAPKVLGHTSVRASSVCCAYDGVLKVRVDASNAWYMALSLSGLPGPGGQERLKVSLIGPSTDLEMTRSWGAVWKVDGKRLSGTYAIRVTFPDAGTLTTEPCVSAGTLPRTVVACKVK